MSNTKFKITKVNFEEANLPEQVKTHMEKEYKHLMNKWNKLFADYEKYDKEKQEDLDIINVRYGSSVSLQWTDRALPVGVFMYKNEPCVIYTTKIKCKIELN